jgi:hypothetical protein
MAVQGEAVVLDQDALGRQLVSLHKIRHGCRATCL